MCFGPIPPPRSAYFLSILCKKNKKIKKIEIKKALHREPRRQEVLLLYAIFLGELPLSLKHQLGLAMFLKSVPQITAHQKGAG